MPGFCENIYFSKEMCAYTDSNINKENLEFMLTSYQKRKTAKHGLKYGI